MRLDHPALAQDLARPVAGAVTVLAIELDQGLLLVGGADAQFGGESVVGAVLSIGAVSASGLSFTLERQAVPDSFQSAWWGNRPVSVFDVPPGASSVMEGARLFDGVVKAEPAEQAGVWSLACLPARKRQLNLPAYPAISAADYPWASGAAMGKLPPVLFGTVEDAPLLAVKTVAATTLRTDAVPGDSSLAVADATGLPASGAVWVDGESLPYSSRTGTLLLGCAVRNAHAAGTAVLGAGEAQYLAAGHACASITLPRSGGAVLSGFAALSDRLVFQRTPLAPGAANAQNVLVQFDQVGTAAIPFAYAPAYPAAESLSLGGGVVFNVLADLGVWIVPPATLSPGSYSFTVTVAPQARLDVDNAPGVYTATLGGQAFTLPKAGGTVTVSMALSSAAPLLLAHDVTADLDVAVAAPLGITADMAAKLKSRQFSGLSGIEAIVPKITSVAVSWTQGSLANAASNPANAIRAVTATVSQSAAGWDTSIAATGKGNILFARPNADRIVSGAYAIGFNVALNGYVGPVVLKIGGKTAYVADGGAVVYQANPFYFTDGQDTDAVPVALDGGGLATVAVVSASRTVGTGNVDGGKYATLAYAAGNRLFRAVQTTDNPDRGTVTRARLAVEWFSADTLPASTVAVRFGGRLLGYLQSNTLAGSTLSQTVSVDVLSQGSAALQNSDVSVAVSGGTGTLSNTTTVDRTAYPVFFRPKTVGGTTRWQFYLKIKPPQNVVAGNHPVTIQWSDGLPGPVTPYQGIGLYDDFAGALSRVSTPSGPSVETTSYFTVASANSTVQVAVLMEHVQGLTLPSGATLTDAVVPHYVQVDWTVSPVARNDTPAAGSLSVNNNALPNSGIALRTNNGAFTLAIPAPPRTTVTEFDLPDVADWASLTGKSVEIEMLASAPNVYLVQIQLPVDFSAVQNQAATVVTATVESSLDGNPASVLAWLASQTGETLDQAALARFSAWCQASGYGFARRIAKETDAYQMMVFAAEQAGAVLARRAGGLAPVRWFDLSSEVLSVGESDLLEPASIGWADRVETDITLHYREDCAGGSGFLRSLAATAANNRYCALGEAALKRRVPVTVEAGFIRDDAVAALFLADYARRFGRPRRIVSLALPYLFSTLEKGDLVEYLPPGTQPGFGIFGRVTARSDESGWPRATLEEIPT